MNVHCSLSLEKQGMRADNQFPIKVFYDGQPIGEYYADILVNEEVILELKTAESICEEHEAQLLNYLRATEIEVGYLLNCGKKPAFARKVFSNQYKNLR